MKAGKITNTWLVYVACAVLVLGLYFAVRGAVQGVAYGVAVLIGAVLGRFWHSLIHRKKPTLFINVLTLAVLLSLLMGSIGTNRMTIVILFLIGIGVSYLVHQKQWFKTA